jgi:hypothetical protein
MVDLATSPHPGVSTAVLAWRTPRASPATMAKAIYGNKTRPYCAKDGLFWKKKVTKGT